MMRSFGLARVAKASIHFLHFALPSVVFIVAADISVRLTCPEMPSRGVGSTGSRASQGSGLVFGFQQCFFNSMVVVFVLFRIAK
jgi:hypothetical protein